MGDPRLNKIAENIIKNSLKLKAGEKVLIRSYGVPDDMIESLIKQTYSVGGVPILNMSTSRVLRQFLRGADEQTMALWGETDLFTFKKADAFIDMRGQHNTLESSDIPEEKQILFEKYWYNPIYSDFVIPKLRWLFMTWPTTGAAQQAYMSTESFENLYFASCMIDYAKFSQAMDPLVNLLLRTDHVRIVSPGTDLEFSIKGIPVVKCCGEHNLPDGEVFTAPVRDSANGVIRYNAKTSVYGDIVENVEFSFKDGKINKVSSSNTPVVENYLDRDEGARYLGEFGIGLNPYIKNPTLNQLYDEKIAGSVHITPGNSYDIASNGNHSGIHWDIVLMQMAEHGGGELYFDGELIRKDGVFVLEELAGLNPQNLEVSGS